MPMIKRVSTDNMAWFDYTESAGLGGTKDSPGYRLEEIERHFHNDNWCFGNNGANNMLLDSLVTFQVTAGVGSAYGAELQIHDGTVIEGGDPLKYHDLGRIFVTTSSAVNSNYLIQFTYGLTTFAASTFLTSFYFRSASNQARVSETFVPCRRITCNNKIWARCKCQTNAATCDFLFEIHTYDS